MVYSDVNLALGDRLEAIVERLNGDGFFYAGLRPGAARHDADVLRLQKPLPGAGDVHAFELESEWAHRLAAFIGEDEERVGAVG